VEEQINSGAATEEIQLQTLTEMKEEVKQQVIVRVLLSSESTKKYLPLSFPNLD
jgi:hypothetical protein